MNARTVTHSMKEKQRLYLDVSPTKGTSTEIWLYQKERHHPHSLLTHRLPFTATPEKSNLAGDQKKQWSKDNTSLGQAVEQIRSELEYFLAEV